MRPRRTVPLVLVVAAVLALAGPAGASYPFVGAGTLHDQTSWHVAPGHGATGVTDEIKCDSDKSAATPEPNYADCDGAGGEPGGATDNQNASVRADAHELGGVRGDSTADYYATDPFSNAAVQTAWNVTTGRPDVTIAALDYGMKWNSEAAMGDLARKVRLNTGELPVPNHSRTTPLEAINGENQAITCSSYVNAYDANGDGVVDLDDYACDGRVSLTDARRAGPAGVLTPQDLIIAFSDGTDADHNGYVDDIAGWDFVDDDNDPYNDVQYGGGEGQAADSTAEANDQGAVGMCPNCTVLPLRVGESFVTDADRFASAVLYATDNGASVIQEALGTLNAGPFARNAIDYAYHHGVTLVASSAEEAAQHHNEPGSLPHTILVNSVRNYYTKAGAPVDASPRSYLYLNGCTNFGARVTVSVPSDSCSSEATGRAAGEVGLIYSAALDEHDAHPATLPANPGCHRATGTNGASGQACVITPDEVRQLVQSGADDVDFTNADATCASNPMTCTDPNLNADVSGRTEIAPDSFPYPARKGFDEFYGYGRLNAYRAVSAAAAGRIPPEVSIESPDWWTQADPASTTVDIRGRVAAVHATAGYTCQVYVAPGVDPSNGSDVSSGAYASTATLGDFHAVGAATGAWCDGTSHSASSDADMLLGSVNVAALKAMFPAATQQTGFTGNENGTTATAANGETGQTQGGRPNTEPYAFTVKVVVTTNGGTPLRGEDRRELYLHRDQDLLRGWPQQIAGDGDSSPVLADVDGDNRNELVFATADGTVEALRADGTELPGFPVHGDPPPLHPGGPALASGGVAPPAGAPFFASVAVGDLDGDGAPEIVAADTYGRVYAWSSTGQRVLSVHSDPAFSGAPQQPFATVRRGALNRTEAGFIGSPVLADLDGDGRKEIIAAGEDRHLYAWHADGTPVAGFPVLIVDPAKVQSVAPGTDAVTFKATSGAYENGKLVDTPAVGDVDGDGRPDILIGSNEEYASAQDGGTNGASGALTTQGLDLTGLLPQANGRLYAVRATGTAAGSPFLSGWPARIGLLDAQLLPDIGEGIDGSPVIARLTCPSGGTGAKVGVTPAAGLGYVLNGDGSSCYGSAAGEDDVLETTAQSGPGQTDHPLFPAFGLPAFGDLSGTGQLSLVAPAGGLLRTVDVLLTDEQRGGQDFTAAWNAATGQMDPGFPAPQNDLSILTGPVVGQLTANGPDQDVVAGTSSLDLQAVDGLTGAPVSTAWPKFTGGWTAATPALGSFGTLDTDAAARKDVVAFTRDGTLSAYASAAPACSPSSWPRFHHDDFNSGNYATDAIAPGAPTSAAYADGSVTFTAPGDDLLCGTATRYQVLSSDAPITGGEAGWTTVTGVTPKAAGSTDAVPVTGTGRYFAIRAVDDQGNVGRPAVVGVPAAAAPTPAPPAATPPAVKRPAPVTVRPPAVVSPALACTTADAILIDVARHGSRVRVSGAARPTLVGKRVSVLLAGVRKPVATTVVAADGTFAASAALPPKRLRTSNATRYSALVGTVRTAALKLNRRAHLTSVTRTGTTIKVAGAVTGHFRRGTAVKIGLRVTCAKYLVVGKAKLGRTGTFTATVAAPSAAGREVAVYRATTTVLTGRHREPTATLPLPPS